MDTTVDRPSTTHWVIRYYSSPEVYQTLGVATGKTAEDAIGAFLSRVENKNEIRQLTADEITEVDWSKRNGR